MKKAVFILFFVLTSVVGAQNHNPDGDAISIHISPYTNFGVVDNINLTPSVNVNVLMKIPLQHNITISPFYEYNEVNASDAIRDIATGRTIENGFKSIVRRAGVVLSIYFK